MHWNSPGLHVHCPGPTFTHFNHIPITFLSNYLKIPQPNQKRLCFTIHYIVTANTYSRQALRQLKLALLRFIIHDITAHSCGTLVLILSNYLCASELKGPPL